MVIRRKRSPQQKAIDALASAPKAVVGGGIALAAAGIGFAARKLRGAAGERAYDDVTLTRKVESEIFRPADAPKGKVAVNAENGVIFLRGTLDSREQVEELATLAAAVDGVKGVENLLSAK
jgi:osmotically-inducible protein OsmY